VLSEMQQLADDVVVIERGRLVRQAPVRELTHGGRSLEDVFFELTEEASR
jgi:ABC-2 type transport system ATP-binding protein